MHRLMFFQRRALGSKRAVPKEIPELVEKTKDEPKNNKYSSTVLLPQTRFLARVVGKNRVEMDNVLTKKCGFSELYSWQRANLLGPDFVLHDGPPYANGVPHMGHAINKILKDITLRNKVIRGRRVHYVPGWDCHGLPIEMKVFDIVKNHVCDPLGIRRQARKYAEEAIKNQSEAFQSWGVMADWGETGCYFTNRSSYMKNQLHQFINMYDKGLIFRDFKPVYWSPSSRTALAESELEYNEQHCSKCAIVRLRLDNLSPRIKPFETRTIYALTWTTTPWTLVANQALAYSSDATYCLAEGGDGNIYIVAEPLLANIESKIGTLKPLTKIEGREFEGTTYFHPFGGGKLPFLAARHVTTTLGTGLVHTAPAHGPEDFLVALDNDLNVLSLVDVDGRYTKETGSKFCGLEVSKDGTEKVLEHLASDILHVETITHSYPYDWRTKKPVLIRASNQWFIDINAIKQKAIDSISEIKIYPESNRTSFVNALLAQIKQRSYWCISRQRSWGTPIPVLCSKKTGKASTSRALIERLCYAIDEYGPDCWWELSLEKLVGLDIINDLNIEQNIDDVEKGKDIMDIWFDSGISWSAVLPNKKADLYLEGLDQFTGWFQSSLLTSIALQGCPPYRSLFVHGFAVDQKASKMSKSMGNVVNPEDILKGQSRKTPAYGIDTLRWWVANHGCHHSQVPVTKTLLDGCAQSVQKLRLVLRFLLGILHPHSTTDNIEPQYRIIDKYMLYSLYKYDNQIQQHYNDYEYHHVCKRIIHFVANDISAFYCHLTKDRLYCDEASSPTRIAVIKVAGQIVNVLARSIAPILPHLAEEVWQHYPENFEAATLYSTKYEIPESWNEPSLHDIMSVALRMKDNLNKIVDTNSKEVSITIEATKIDLACLRILQDTEESSISELCEILQVSSIKLIGNGTVSESRILISNIEKNLCERCRRYPEVEEGGLCARCAKLLAEIQ